MSEDLHDLDDVAAEFGVDLTDCTPERCLETEVAMCYRSHTPLTCPARVRMYESSVHKADDSYRLT